jgi:hypothetical protein
MAYGTLIWWYDEVFIVIEKWPKMDDFFSKICFAEIANLKSIWPYIEILIPEILFFGQKISFPIM